MGEIVVPKEKFEINSFNFSEIPIENWFKILKKFRSLGKQVLEVPIGSEMASYSDRILYTTGASYCSAGMILVPDQRICLLFHYQPVAPNTPRDQLPLLLRTEVRSIGGIRGGTLAPKPENERLYDKFNLQYIPPKSFSYNFALLVNPIDKKCLWAFQPYYGID